MTTVRAKSNTLRLRRAKAPAVPARPFHFTLHGETIPDEFAWLKAQNWREVLKTPAALPQDIRQCLEAENAYAGQVLKPLGGLRRTLLKELRGRVQEDDSTPPMPDGPFLYGERYREGGQQPIVWREPRTGGERHTLLDGDREARAKDFFELGGWVASPDHRLMAWMADEKGSEFYTIAIRDLASGKDCERLTGASASVLWSDDGDWLFYVALDAQARPHKVMRHRLGRPQTEDACIHAEAEPGFFVDLGQTQDGTLGLIEISDHQTSEIRLIELQHPEKAPRLVQARTTGIEYDLDRHGEAFVIRTNAGGALDFRLARCGLDDTAIEGWQALVPHREGWLIDEHAVFADFLVRLERKDGLPRIVIREWRSGEEHAIAFDEEAYDLSFEPGYEYETTTLRFTYSSLTTPDETYDYDMRSRQRRLVKRQAIPSGHDPAQYVTRRIFATAQDGVRVPITVLHRVDTPLDGRAPLLLEGYGAYGYATMPAFDENNFSLVDRGFVYALAHVRGGTECGYRWYLDGKRENKPNSFSDFVACGEHLAAERYTSHGRIVAYGASAGGMLMGAVANLAPELFAGIIAEVPFVDVLNTMLDGDLPLTPPEWPEWGNPRTSEADFRAILGYSPYDNVRAQAYPPILAIGGLTDPRVTYWEPLKWVARLRARMSGGGPVALRTNMGAGHDGAAGRLDRLSEIAFMHAFAIAVAGAPGALLPAPLG